MKTILQINQHLKRILHCVKKERILHLFDTIFFLVFNNLKMKTLEMTFFINKMLVCVYLL
jgi:hypothetical protein